MTPAAARSSLRPRRAPAVLAAFAGLILALSACSTGTDAVDTANGGEYRFVQAQPAGEVIAVGDRQPAPDFSGTLLDGGTFKSSSLAGDVAVLNFWGSWCPPCRVETPEFEEVYTARADQGVQFLGINVKDSQQLADAFLEDKQITYPSLFDPRSELALVFRNFPPEQIPSTIVLDRKGRVAAVYLGAISKDKLDQVLDTVLGEKT